MRGLATMIALTFCSVGCDALFGLDPLKNPGIDAQYLDARVDAGVLPDATCTAGLTVATYGALKGGTGQASMIDTYVISSTNASKNYGSAPTLALCGFTTTGCSAGGRQWDNKETLSLLRFDLSSVCAGSMVENAVLKLTTDGDELGSGELGFFVVLEQWDEGTGGTSGLTDGAASWNMRTTSAAWKNVGVGASMSREATPVAMLVPSDPHKTYDVALPVDTVQRWLDNPGSNFGLAIVVTKGNSDAQFVSREGADDMKRPGLVLSTRL